MEWLENIKWLNDLLRGETVAHSVLILALVAASGVFLGSFKIRGVGLGIAGVLFTGLLFGHFGFHVNKEVIEFVRDFGLILFVYTIGMQVGPGFAASLRKQGLPLNIMAASVVGLGVLVAIGVYYFAKLDMSIVIGLFSGGTTNTPALGAAQQALKSLPAYTEQMGKNPGLGYAVAYPFGIIGIILTMGIIRALFKVDPIVESAKFSKQMLASHPKPGNLNIIITNRELDGSTIGKIAGLDGSGVVISRILKGKRMAIATPETELHIGDVVHAVGPEDKLKETCAKLGAVAAVDLKAMPSNLTTRRVVVTRKNVLGKTIDELDLDSIGVAVTRVSRAEIEFTPTSGFTFQYADTVLIVGEPEDIDEAAKELGNSPKALNHPQIIPVFFGIALGVFVGSIPIALPGVPAPVKLGLAGGPLLIAILLSRLGRVGPLICYMPLSANFMVRELGITLFLACVGLKAGDQFIHTLTHGDGLLWMGLAALITFLPIMIVGFIARAVFKLNYTSICGVLAGSMTDPPALAFANTMAGSDAPSVSYATVYPLTMLLRVFTAQLLVLIFMR
jgi:putative transport protein